MCVTGVVMLVKYVKTGAKEIKNVVRERERDYRERGERKDREPNLGGKLGRTNGERI